MSIRTLTHRNFIGALFGGIAGILTFAMVAEWLLPVGLLLGVVTGFWYDVIFERCTKQFFADLAAVYLAVIPLLGIMHPLWLWQGSMHGATGNIVISCVHAAICVYTAVLTIWFCSNIVSPNMNSQFENMSVWKYIRMRATFFTLAPIVGLQFLLICVLWVTFGLAYLIVAGIALPPVIFLRNMVRVMGRSEHWTCLTVTLIITGLCAMFLRPTVENQIVLWVTALVSGVLSGLFTIAVQHYVAPYFGTKRIIQSWMQSGTLKSEWKNRWTQLALIDRLSVLTLTKRVCEVLDGYKEILWPKESEPKPENA
ncbi:MAG: hypothetical protein WCV85_02375 [Patescibacteria group bacterium]|jgi:hypothetical protein